MINECTGKCELCNINQRTYCAAQMVYYMQEELASIRSMLQMPENEKSIIIRTEPHVPGAEQQE